MKHTRKNPDGKKRKPRRQRGRTEKEYMPKPKNSRKWSYLEGVRATQVDRVLKEEV